MNFTGIIGVLAGFLAIAISIMISGEIGAFWDVPSVLITIGGTIFATIASYSFKQFAALGKMLPIAMKKEDFDVQESIDLLLELSMIQRKNGTLALEEEAAKLEEPFLKKGILMIVDGSDPEPVKNIMETEMNFIEERHGQGQAVLLSMSSFSPAFGMVGTLIGLINMLGDLENTSALGPSMAVALITTFYGVVMANLVFTPLATRLKERTTHELRHKEMLLEGILSIQAGENPRIIEQKLKAYLSDTEKRKMEAKEKVEEAAVRERLRETRSA
ncbi:MAG TPA: motility protein A [Clostridiales bacterium]|nr:motility protein A [Clostridiales bacterium]